MSIRPIITNPYGPNTTVLLPGDCNAHCEFCFWNRDEANIPFDHTFSDKAIAQLARLPAEFNCLSVSGGEPTYSPEYTRFCLALIANRKNLLLERTVLTTHGGRLAQLLDVTLAAFDHINISRHGIGDEANFEVFKTRKVPTDAQLRKVISDIHSMSRVDVTLNCVVPANVTRKFITEFIAYAKELGADAVSFRKVASDASPTAAELHFRKTMRLLNETLCPVCRGAVTVDATGFQVRWKGSVEEPSVQTNGVYEAVLHPDAKVYADWNRQIPFPFKAMKEVQRVVMMATAPPAKSRRKPVQRNSGGGGCGSGGVGCGSSGGGGCGSGGGGCGR